MYEHSMNTGIEHQIIVALYNLPKAYQSFTAKSFLPRFCTPFLQNKNFLFTPTQETKPQDAQTLRGQVLARDLGLQAPLLALL